MYSFFKRHEVDKKAEGFNRGEKGFPTNGKIAWELWSGDPGFKWSTRIWEKYKEENKALEHLEKLFNEESSDELIKSILLTAEDNSTD